jgi:hypothetical protein
VSKKSVTVKVLRKHFEAYTAYSMFGWGKYDVMCECGETFRGNSFAEARELHCEHVYAKLKKALKKRKKKSPGNKPRKITDGQSITTYFQKSTENVGE